MELLIYLTKSIFSVAILYMVYMLFFRAQNSLVFNRIFLLAILVIGLLGPLIPLVNIPLINNSNGIINNSMSFTILLEELNITSNKISNNSFISSPESILLITYLAISSIIFLSLVYRLFGILKLVYTNKVINNQGFKFVLLEDNMPAFSFFNYIFISESIYKNSSISEGIISHEKVHAIQKHSLDILFAELLIIIQWVNPLSYLLKRSIRENHEFLADRGVLMDNTDFEQYKLLLLQNSSLLTINSITHNFSYSLLKKRINMMTRKNSKIKLVLGAILLPIAFGITILACSSPQKDEALTEEMTNTEQTKTEQSENAEMNQEKEVATSDQVYKVVETMPEFPGGTSELYKYLGENIKYPESAKKEGIQGRVFISFVVNKDGSISDVKKLRGVSEELDKEAMRVIKNMPKWKPGEQRGEKVKVEYALPINFKLN
ncbi:MAG: hypothetical protein C0595_14540 [Marinilabiliales bacterium]|nr:MAG: hypothetical protein C0595_14540 [Marinilabiliales bacterium]